MKHQAIAIFADASGEKDNPGFHHLLIIGMQRGGKRQRGNGILKKIL
jgi:hypothetical protein